MSELLAAALSGHERVLVPFAWTTRPMQRRVDLDDKEALRSALDEAPRAGRTRQR